MPLFKNQTSAHRSIGKGELHPLALLCTTECWDYQLYLKVCTPAIMGSGKEYKQRDLSREDLYPLRVMQAGFFASTISQLDQGTWLRPCTQVRCLKSI